MTNPILVVVLLGSMLVTSYRSVPSQTDNSPNFTSIGERCNVHGVAVSQELLIQNGGPLRYGDLVLIEGVGYRIVNDCMAKRWMNRMDVWVESYDDEKAFDKKFRGRKLRIWKINGGINETYRRLHYHSK